MSSRGLFVSFEGGEGSGKSTQADLLARRLQSEGHDVVLVREPGGSALGEQLRRLLLHSETKPRPEAELLLFLAARAELVRSVIEPALSEGRLVICDRFSDSTLAYQGYGRGLDIETVRRTNAFATDGLEPDLTVLLDLPVTAGRERQQASQDDAFQREDDAFHERVRRGYLELARAEPQRWLVLDALSSEEDIAAEVFARVELNLAGA